MRSKALRELGADIDGFDEGIEVIRADSTSVVVEPDEFGLRRAAQTLIPLYVDTGLGGDLPVEQSGVAAKNFGRAGAVHARRRSRQEIVVENKMTRDRHLALRNAGVAFERPRGAGEAGVVRRRG